MHAPSTLCAVEKRHRLRTSTFTEAFARPSHANNLGLTKNPNLFSSAHQLYPHSHPPKTTPTPQP